MLSERQSGGRNPDPTDIQSHIFMNSLLESNAVLLKTRELCATLVEQPNFQAIRQSIERFAADRVLRDQLTELNTQGAQLQQKQQFGMPMDEAEIASFEALREQFLGNSVARDFIDAQESMREMQETIGEHVSKTFELGRVPRPTDFETECDSDCGCGTEPA